MVMTMQMWFEATTAVTLWFRSWHTHTVTAYALSCAGLFLFCVLHEALTSFRAQYQAGGRSKSGGVGLEDDTSEASERAAIAGSGVVYRQAGLLQGARSPPRIFHRIAISLLYAVNLAMSYLLMLAVMTFNVGYFVVIVLGLATGHFIFFRGGAGGSSDVCHAQAFSDL
ncbi:hypothetical protein WJX72_001385 [[Myrmecia] bisecta]|uniref:Copper transport protein n=1 Tax=[Myrmecia] bisecta TaxID=41462 RepID=A0AAW1R5W5_9CHLO